MRGSVHPSDRPLGHTQKLVFSAGGRVWQGLEEGERSGGGGGGAEGGLTRDADASDVWRDPT